MRAGAMGLALLLILAVPLTDGPVTAVMEELQPLAMPAEQETRAPHATPPGASGANWQVQVVSPNGSAIPNATAFWTTALLAQAADGWPTHAAARVHAVHSDEDGWFALPTGDSAQRLRVEADGYYPWEGGFREEVVLHDRGNVAAIGHRGAAAYAPENTLPSLDVAWALGADRVEVDVRLTADDVAVIIHDALVDRTTDGTGAVAAMTLADLRALDAGSWFHDDYAGTQVPTLDEVLDWSNTTGVPLLIEVKEEPPRSALALQKVIEALSKHGFLVWDAWVASFDPVPGHSCAWAHRYDCGWIIPTDPDQRDAALATATASNVPFIVAPVSYVDQAFVNATRQRGIDVLAYTANAEATQQRLVDTGAAGIITDRPERLVALLTR